MVKEGNLHNPLNFFISITKEGVFKNLLLETLEYNRIPYSFVNSTTLRITYEEDGIWEEEDVHISFFVENKLNNELTKSRDFIQTYTLENSTEKAIKYLKIQFSFIQLIINNRAPFLVEYPYIFNFFKKLAGYIVFLLKSLDVTDIQLDYRELKKLYEQNNRATTTQKKDKDLIMSVLSYMKGQNHMRETILSETDFDLLIQYTTHLIEKEELPEIKTQLSPNIHQRLLAFSFWVLHKELYTTKRIKPFFISFLKNVFSNFNDVTEKIY
ncbi:hypothetical protein CAPN006_19650 [Capnocytophaga canimorsus]|uniref:hypothetical protein n=1 Tax=Capnocytophaga canimorsus TaxID=28188 RepID=UPI001ACF8A0D|nr:hypothetical protein [Capnocytophaga canimorsus]GIM57573.1 hypothetical protein CAPN006_19650 [Capnocytophaga canimorsus]